MAVRIIGGQMRGRKLEVPNSLGLRPTSDRTRETLFNWLQSIVPGARCLDLFSGSGALGLESISRGAAQVVSIEKHRKVFQVLEARVPEWRLGDGYQLVRADAFTWLSQFKSEGFDCIFIDPPFQMECLDQVVTLVRQKAVLIDGGLLYIERPQDQLLPSGLEVWKEQRAGTVVFGLYKFKVSESILSA